MLKKIDHIGIAVDNLESVIKTLQEGFGLHPSFLEEIADQKVRVAGYNLGESTIEYLEPTTSDSPISKFLEKKKNGIHHIAFETTDLEKTLNQLNDGGFRLIDETPRKGANGKKIAFLHPSSFNGILIELCEK